MLCNEQTVESFHPPLSWSKARRLGEHTAELPDFWACPRWTGHDGPESSRTWTVYSDPSVPHRDNDEAGLLREWQEGTYLRTKQSRILKVWWFSAVDYHREPWWRTQAILWGMGISTKKRPKESAQGYLESQQTKEKLREGILQGLDFGWHPVCYTIHLPPVSFQLNVAPVSLTKVRGTVDWVSSSTPVQHWGFIFQWHCLQNRKNSSKQQEGHFYKQPVE